MSTGGSGTPINKPLGHLDSTYFPSATSSHMSRTAFLNGTYKTYFGSGQSPDGMTGSITRGGYQKPVDWNKANTLLRTPQQVWLAADIAINLNVQISSFSYTGHGPLEAPVLLNESAAWSDGTSNTITNDLSTGIITQAGSDGQPEPFVRVNQAFLDAQTKINTLRAGRTFVDVINYVNYYNFFQGSFYDNPAYPNPLGPRYMDGPGYYYASPNNVSPIPNYTYDQWVNTSSIYISGIGKNVIVGYPALNGGCFPWVTAPDPTEEFFGTDFLHIYCSGGRYLMSQLFMSYFISPDAGTAGTQRPPYFDMSDPTYLSSRCTNHRKLPQIRWIQCATIQCGPRGEPSRRNVECLPRNAHRSRLPHILNL